VPSTVTRRRRFRRPEWLSAPKPDDDGSMALVDHLKELRYRVIVSVLAILATMVGALFLNERLLDLVFKPYVNAIDIFRATHPDSNILMATDGLAGGMMLTLKVALYAGLVVSCPVWLYQIWAFIAPGLLAKEKRYSLMFLGASIPLFLSGVALGYWISPKGFVVLLGFTPENVSNIQDVNKFLQFLSVTLLVFGIAFLLPVILVTLNLLGILPARMLAKYRAVGIFLCFLFGAIATPSQDPFSMCALAVPMAVMYLVSEVICRVNDKRRAAASDLVLVD